MAKAKKKSLLDGLVVRKGAAMPAAMPIVPLNQITGESGKQTWTNSSIDPSLMLTPDPGSHRKSDLPNSQLPVDDGVAASNFDRQNHNYVDRMALGESSCHGVVVEKLPEINQIADVFCARQNAQFMTIPAVATKTGTAAYSAVVYLRADQLTRLNEIAASQHKNISKLVESAVDCFLDDVLSRR